MLISFCEKAKKERESAEGGWWRQTDVAGGLKCSSRDLTLEFAGNRTGLRGPREGEAVCVRARVHVHV